MKSSPFLRSLFYCLALNFSLNPTSVRAEFKALGTMQTVKQADVRTDCNYRIRYDVATPRSSDPKIVDVYTNSMDLEHIQSVRDGNSGKKGVTLSHDLAPWEMKEILQIFIGKDRAEAELKSQAGSLQHYYLEYYPVSGGPLCDGVIFINFYNHDTFKGHGVSGYDYSLCDTAAAKMFIDRDCGASPSPSPSPAK